MKNKESNEAVQKRDEAEEKVEEAKKALESLPRAAQPELRQETRETEIMVDALSRDLEEVEDPDRGADEETVEKLADSVRQKVGEMESDKEFLSLGNPTTIDTAVDATMDAVDAVVEKAEEIASRAKETIRTVTKGNQ